MSSSSRHARKADDRPSFALQLPREVLLIRVDNNVLPSVIISKSIFCDSSGSGPRVQEDHSPSLILLLRILL